MQLFGLFAHLCQSDELPLLPPPLVSTPPPPPAKASVGVFLLPLPAKHLLPITQRAPGLWCRTLKRAEREVCALIKLGGGVAGGGWDPSVMRTLPPIRTGLAGPAERFAIGRTLRLIIRKPKKKKNPSPCPPPSPSLLLPLPHPPTHLRCDGWRGCQVAGRGAEMTGWEPTAAFLAS